MGDHAGAGNKPDAQYLYHRGGNGYFLCEEEEKAVLLWYAFPFNACLNLSFHFQYSGSVKEQVFGNISSDMHLYPDPDLQFQREKGGRENTVIIEPEYPQG